MKLNSEDELRAACDFVNLIFIFDELSDCEDAAGVQEMADTAVAVLRNLDAPRPADERLIGEVIRQSGRGPSSYALPRANDGSLILSPRTPSVLSLKHEIEITVTSEVLRTISSCGGKLSPPRTSVVSTPLSARPVGADHYKKSGIDCHPFSMVSNGD